MHQIDRRRAVALFAAACLPLVARKAAAAGRGLEIHFAIDRSATQPSGMVDERHFANAVRVASGETLEVDFRGDWRVRIGATDDGDAARVTLALWDNQDDGHRAGDAVVAVPFDHERRVTLLTSTNVRTQVTLRARRASFDAR